MNNEWVSLGRRWSPAGYSDVITNVFGFDEWGLPVDEDVVL